MQPTDDQIKRASKDVAWEYAAMLAAAVEMAKGSWEGFCSPMNHFVQEAFLAHVRNLAGFFRDGADKFTTGQACPQRKEDRPDIYAVDFCVSVGWHPEPFDRKKKLIKAIDKTLAHMTYSRDRASPGHVHFEGYEHVHGTVKLMRQTWADFMKSVRPEFLEPKCSQDIRYWLVRHTEQWRVKFSELENEFERRARELSRAQGLSPWRLNETPDGPV